MHVDWSVLVLLWYNRPLDAYQLTADELPLDMVGIATAVRASIIRSRDPQDIANYMSTASNCLLTNSNSGKSMFFAIYEDELFVNSTVS